MKEKSTDAGLYFVAYEIFLSTADEVEDQKIRIVFFEVPPTNRLVIQTKLWGFNGFRKMLLRY